MTKDGITVGLSQTAVDINRYYDIYGSPIEPVGSKTVNKMTNIIIGTVMHELQEQYTWQELISHKMHIGKGKFLIS